jgi:hypothetical protein
MANPRSKHRLLLTLSIPIAFLAFAILSVSAKATGTYCVVVKATSDRFLNLRAGPGANFSIIAKVFPSDLLEMDTGDCRTTSGKTLCDPTHRWGFVEGVPRLDKVLGTFTQGWISTRFVRQVECIEEKDVK